MPPKGADIAMDEKRLLLHHFLAALAYRTQKALRGAPADFGSFRAADNVRTPAQIVCHMTSVLGYARTYFTAWSQILVATSRAARRCSKG